MAHERAGQVAQEQDLINVDEVLSAYYDITPDPSNVDQQVVFGTSGHRGSSLDGKFNELHIAATTQAIVEYRASQDITGPLERELAAVIDAGACYKEATTVIDLTPMAEGNDPVVIRQGRGELAPLGL